VTPDELQRELADGQIRPVYLLAGAEVLLRDDAARAIRDVVVTGAPDFNFDRLSGDSATPAALESSLGTLPVMAERRLVVLAEPEQKRGSSKALTDAIASALPSLLAQEKSSGAVETVFVVTAAKVDKRSRWFKALAKPAAVVACDPPKGQREIVAFVRAEAEAQGLLIEAPAAKLLAEQIGPQLLMLRQEIGKLALLVESGEALKRTHVEMSTSALAEQPIWDLTDAIGAGRTAEAIVRLERMLSLGSPAPVVLGTLAQHFRKLSRLSSGGKVVGPPFVVKNLKSQANRYTARRLVSCLRAIHDTDTALKGAGVLPANLALERLVIGLAS
jgi:DNA polymerase-3 subunit delta